MKDVEGKAAFITGGASGAGFGMAKAFSKAGMKVVIADIRPLMQTVTHQIHFGDSYLLVPYIPAKEKQVLLSSA